MATALDIIKGAMRDIGAIAAGEAPSGSESTDALEALNDMLEDWSNDGLLIYENAIENFTLTSGTNNYSIGSGATFDTVRPELIKDATIKLSAADSEIPMKVLNIEEWSRIQLKSIQSTLPQLLFYNPTFPNGTIYLYPTPSAASVLTLYTKKPLSSFATTGTTVTLPMGYKRALRKNLAIELADEFGASISQNLMMLATQSKAWIKRKNKKIVLMRNETANLNDRRPFNYLLGD